jgi:Zn-dependent protease with chaperone function
VKARVIAGLLAAALLAGCALPPPASNTQLATLAEVEPGAKLTPEQAARTFVLVVRRVVPVAEEVCLQRTRNVPCDFQIAIDDRPGQPPNAFQTVDDQGNPVIAFNLALLMDVRNADELAFVMGHETAHHIAGHLDRQQSEMLQGALIAGALATLGGGSESTIRAAQDMGAEFGARRYSKAYELEADALGTEIAWRAGFDPLVGAQFFRRLPDPGNEFLGTHPPTAQRYDIVVRTMQTLQ